MTVLKVTGSKKIATLQKEFNTLFPFLKLEFFNHRHGAFSGSPRTDMFNTNMLFSECRKKKTNGSLVIHEGMKVMELEESFQKVFGLSVQVFRKSGRSWLETTVTDDWTLERQNSEGKELSFLTK